MSARNTEEVITDDQVIEDWLRSIQDAAAREFFRRIWRDALQGGEIKNIIELLAAASVYPGYNVHIDKIPGLVESDPNIGPKDTDDD